ncbi:MAG TPA: redoxin domain-containing protein [Prolixibacteraceae bacterium]
MLRKLFIIWLLVMPAYLQITAQPINNKNELPPFTLQLTNGSIVSYKTLSQKKPVILIYFAPGCEHCREFIKKLVGKIKLFEQAQIVLVSYFPLADLQKFSTEFKLDQLSNVKVGTEGNSFRVPALFKIVKFPFTAVYNKLGRLTAIFREEPSLNVLSDLLKKQ